MEEKDFQEISIVKLVKKAEVGRATFYRNFDSIEDVLRLECDQAFDELRLKLMEYYKSVDGTTSKTVFIKPLLRFWDTHTDILERLIQANRTHFIQDGITRTVEFMLSLRIDANSKPTSHWDYFIAKRAGEASSILVRWVKNHKDLSADELAELITLQSQESMNLTLRL